MRALLAWIVAVGCSAAAVARADAVPPAPESCPPGLQGRTSHRGPTCTPRRCEDDASCGEGAACVDVAWCQREYESLGRRRRAITRTQTGERCDDGSCPEAGEGESPWECRRWRQCEPTVSTPAWDPGSRSWTGEPHPSEPHPSEPQPSDTQPEPQAEATAEPAQPGREPERADEAAAAPSSSAPTTSSAAPSRAAEEPASGGCAISPVTGRAGWVWIVATIGAAWLRARHRRRATSRPVDRPAA